MAKRLVFEHKTRRITVYPELFDKAYSPWKELAVILQRKLHLSKIPAGFTYRMPGQQLRSLVCSEQDCDAVLEHSQQLASHRLSLVMTTPGIEGMSLARVQAPLRSAVETDDRANRTKAETVIKNFDGVSTPIPAATDVEDMSHSISEPSNDIQNLTPVKSTSTTTIIGLVESDKLINCLGRDRDTDEHFGAMELDSESELVDGFVPVDDQSVASSDPVSSTPCLGTFTTPSTSIFTPTCKKVVSTPRATSNVRTTGRELTRITHNSSPTNIDNEASTSCSSKTEPLFNEDHTTTTIRESSSTSIDRRKRALLQTLLDESLRKSNSTLRGLLRDLLAFEDVVMDSSWDTGRVENNAKETLMAEGGHQISRRKTALLESIFQEAINKSVGDLRELLRDLLGLDGEEGFD